MVLKIDFDSEEALYTQLCNQIICGIAMDVLHDGDSLPSVRQLADEIGINMHQQLLVETGDGSRLHTHTTETQRIDLAKRGKGLLQRPRLRDNLR